MNGALKGDFALTLCCSYRESQSTFEAILTLENIMWPILSQKKSPAAEVD
jgi:hypothetical protein